MRPLDRNGARHFMFATGIECSYPVVTGRDGVPTRMDQLELTFHYEHYKEDLALVKALLARGVPPEARPFGGLVYRQVMEMLKGVRDEAATRALIAQENRRYARRQLIWFRKEPNLIWFDGPGERRETRTRVDDELAARDIRPRGNVP